MEVCTRGVLGWEHSGLLDELLQVTLPQLLIQLIQLLLFSLDTREGQSWTNTLFS